MHDTRTLEQKLHLFLRILGPILVTQIALSAMNFVDTVMAGRFSHVDLAGVAIGTNIWLPVSTGLTGILLALTPIVAQLLGARRSREIGPAVIQGVYLAALLTLAITVGGRLVLPWILGTMELENHVRDIAFGYLGGLAWGIGPLFLYTVLRSFMDALGQTRTTMAITAASLPLNIFFNYVLIFGKWGFPRLGGVGAGYATAVTYWLIAVMSVTVIARVQPFAEYRVWKRIQGPSISAWAEQLRIGLPIGFAIFFETSIFSAVTLLISAFGTVVIAAHQAAMNFAGLVYMLPLSISMALTIAVGFEVGARRPRDAMQYAYLGIGTSLAMAILTAVALLLFRHHVAAWYTTDPAVLAMARSFLFYVIFFQLSDAVAAPIQGVLRGHKDVNAALILSIVSYWVIGLPFGYGLANYSVLGPKGYWIGLITGLAAGAVGLVLRLRVIQRRRDAHGVAFA